MRDDVTTDPDAMREYLIHSRMYRRVAMGIAIFAAVVGVVALIVAFTMMINQQNNLVAGCERGHQRDRDSALLLEENGHHERAELAQERSETDCGKLFSLLP